jgi:ABC-2 type transport system permease protein
MTRYLPIVKGNFMEHAMYPISLFFMLIGNLLYVVVSYFLWKHIFEGREVLNGMTFNEVFVYLTLASSILILFKTYTDWFIARQVLDGNITQDLIKPVDYQGLVMARTVGGILFNAIIITIPTLFVLLVVFRATIPLGINLLFLVPSAAFAFLISFCIDYAIGLMAFYTQSVWGINIMKDVIVSVLSGALIPLAFFPENIQRILEVLPFRAIYGIPLQIATSTSLQFVDYVKLVGIQLFWVVLFLVFSRWVFKRVTGVLMVNGG